jgi:hypothetical protein
MSIVPIQIVDCALHAAVDATLHTGLKSADLLDAEAMWGPIRLKAVADRLRTGAPTDDLPQHSHWDWGRKSNSLQYLANTVFGIQREGKWQGLAMTTTVGHLAWLQSDAGKPLVYVKYIESAPSNLKAFTKTPMYGAIGTAPVSENAVGQEQGPNDDHGVAGHTFLLPAQKPHDDAHGVQQHVKQPLLPVRHIMRSVAAMLKPTSTA